MALAGFSKSPIAAAASLIVALIGLPVLAATPGFTVTETTGSKLAASTSLNPNATATLDVTVSRTVTDQARPLLLTLKWTLPAGVDFVSVSGCTLPDGFDPSKAQPSCTVTDPFAFSSTANAFGTKVVAHIVVRRHFSASATVTACPVASLGAIPVEAVTNANSDGSGGIVDDVTVPGVTINVKPYADIKVTATAPATANQGDTITMSGTISNLGPCDATNVEIDPEESDGAGVTLLTFVSASGACTVLENPDAAGDLAPDPGNDGACVIASLPVGASVTLTKQYKVDSANAAGESETVRTSGLANGGADQTDVNTDNDVADTSTVVPSDAGNCSTGGAVGPLALLGLMLVFSRKRRNS